MKKVYTGLTGLVCLLLLAACGDATSSPVAATTAATTGATAATSVASTAATTARANTTAAATTSSASTTVVAATTAGANTTAAATSTTIAAGSTTAAAGASNTAAGLGLPIYTGLKPLSLGSVFEQTITQSLIGQAGASAKYGIFSTSDSADKVTAFYDDAMKQAGFTKAGSQALPTQGQAGMNMGGKVEAYQKGSGTGATGAVVSLLGPLDATTIALFSSQSATAAQQLKPGDSMVIIFNNVATQNLTLPMMTPTR